MPFGPLCARSPSSASLHLRCYCPWCSVELPMPWAGYRRKLVLKHLPSSITFCSSTLINRNNNNNNKRWKKKLKENLTLFLKNWKAEHFLTGNPFMSLLTIFHSEGFVVIDPVWHLLSASVFSGSLQLMKKEQDGSLTGTALAAVRYTFILLQQLLQQQQQAAAFSSFQMQQAISFLKTSPKYTYSYKTLWQLADHRQQISG